MSGHVYMSEGRFLTCRTEVREKRKVFMLLDGRGLLWPFKEENWSSYGQRKVFGLSEGEV